MSRRTLALIVVLVIITAFLLVIALTPQKPVIPSLTTSQPTPVLAQTTLSLFPNVLNVATSSPSASVDVVIDTGENKVTAVELELSYDPKALASVDITSPVGSFFDNPVALLKKVDAVNGTISYALGIPPTGTGKKGMGTVATITFRAIGSAPQTTAITVLPTTLVTAEGVTSTVLKSSTGATISLTSSFTPPVQPATPSAQ